MIFVMFFVMFFNAIESRPRSIRLNSIKAVVLSKSALSVILALFEIWHEVGQSRCFGIYFWGFLAVIFGVVIRHGRDSNEQGYSRLMSDI